MRRREVYTDGSCLQIPSLLPKGEGGWAWCTPDGYHQSGYVPATTASRMELHAVVEAVQFWTEPLVLYTDSQMIVRCWQNRHYERWLDNDWINPYYEGATGKEAKNRQGKAVKNRDLWEPLTEEFIARRGELLIRWVKGHHHSRWNNQADHLARRARLSQEGEANLPDYP